MKNLGRIGNALWVALLWPGFAGGLTLRAAVWQVPGDYTTIQAAVDAAASGDEIHIAPGTYQEQLLIVRKNLTLTGEPGAVIQAKPSGMTTILAPYDGICATPLFGIALSEVVLKGLTFDGARLGDNYPRCGFVGVMYDGSSGHVEHCTFKGFRQAAGLGDFAGHAFEAVNGISLNRPVQQVQVLRSQFEDNSVSMFLLGDFGSSTSLRLRFSVQDNVIIGSGPTVSARQVGIFISAGASGEVTGNRISGHYYTGAPPLGASGIGAIDWWAYLGNRSPIALQPVQYRDNVFIGNQQNLVSILSSGSQFSNNSFQGSGQDHRDVGLAVSGTNAQIGTNQFSDLGRGVLLLGIDDDWGTLLGTATNPQLTSNNFCDVLTPVLTEPSVTGVVEEGTTVCPPPALEIKPGPTVSWPTNRLGWTLESASDPGGPWQALDGSSVPLHDQSTVTPKISGTQGFFRLRHP